MLVRFEQQKFEHSNEVFGRPAYCGETIVFYRLIDKEEVDGFVEIFQKLSGPTRMSYRLLCSLRFKLIWPACLIIVAPLLSTIISIACDGG